MKSIIQSLKGTRDFYPEVIAVRNWLYQNIAQVSTSFGYQEYDGPFLESIELYAAKSGEELVKEQSFVFPDRGGDLITLRPELTPSLTRMIAQRQRQLIFPLRWWSFGPFWRYERPQKGRTREFFQWNADIMGVDSPEADAENISLIATFFRRVGLTPEDVVILINNRRLLDAQLQKAGISLQQKPQVLRWIDRRDKMSSNDWESYGAEIGLVPSQIAEVIAMLGNQDLWQESEDLVRMFTAAQSLGISPYLRYDPGIVRGLDYYTDTVFEAQEARGDIRRAILGGGRYDNLVSDVGGDPLPGIGFAMGDVVITLILESKGLIPANVGAYPAPVLITVFDAETLPASLAFSTALRQAGVNVNLYPEITKLQKQFKYADRLGIRLAVVIGPDEIAQGNVTIKNLADGSQQTISSALAPQVIKSLL